MMLRNKKTGEIKDAFEVLNMKEEDGVLYKYYSLAELTENWEDYEEPKEYWHISYNGNVMLDIDEECELDNERKLIGNYFDTREEAEKAVEKLKAWKRLKDGGFKFKGYEGIWGETDDGACSGEGKIDFAISGKLSPKDLDLLFGGEE